MRRTLFHLILIPALILALGACGAPAAQPEGGGTQGGQLPGQPEVQLTQFEKLFQYGPLPALDESGLWGYIDSGGGYVIPPSFAQAERFGPDGLALVKDENGLYGYIDDGGTYQIEAQFETAYSFSDGLAAASGPCQVSSGQDGMAVSQTLPGFGYIDTTGSWAIQPRFREAYTFSGGLALVSNFDDPILYGYIDPSGAYAIQPQYLRASTFSGGVAMVMDLGYSMSGVDCYLLIDQQGQVLSDLISPQADGGIRADGSTAFTFSSDLCPIPVFGLEGYTYLRKDGAQPFTQTFQNARTFSNGLAAVRDWDTGLWGYIDTDGSWAIQPQYETAGNFLDCVAVVTLGSLTLDPDSYCYRIIDKTGATVAEYSDYAYVEDLADAMLNNTSTDICGIDPCGNYGRELIPARVYDDSAAFRYGYVDQDWNMVLEPVYDTAGDFAADMSYAKVCQNQRWGMIDREGNVLIPPKVGELR